jgi:lipopolysaccharide biosynthesis glycosyltransferase
LWLDSDLLLLKNWQKIFIVGKKIEAGTKVLAARKHWHVHEGVFSSENLAYSRSNGNYFNSGVMMIDSSKWKADGLQVKAASALSNYDSLGLEWADQCVLNFAIGEDYLPLDEIYNSVPSEFTLGTTSIIHFAGSEKPWIFQVSIYGVVTRRSKVTSIDHLSISERESFLLYRDFEVQTLQVFQRH